MDLSQPTIGLRYGLDIDAYHSGPGVSKSGLDLISRSPYHYWALHLDPNRPPPKEPTPAMALGTMAHCAVLEPDCFNDRYKIALRCDRRTTAGKADWAAFVAGLRPGQTPADPAMVEQTLAMAASVRAIAPLRDLLAVGHPEVSALWIDAPTGVLCRCRPDFVSPAGDGVILCDVKSTTDASPEAFAKTVVNYGYARQAALYCDGFTAASGQIVHGFVFAVVEKEYPFAAAAYMLDEPSLEQGRREYRAALATYAECLRTDTWPGYTAGDEIQLLSLPAWALSKDTQ